MCSYAQSELLDGITLLFCTAIFILSLIMIMLISNQSTVLLLLLLRFVMQKKINFLTVKSPINFQERLCACVILAI